MEKLRINSLRSTKHSSKDERKCLIFQKHCELRSALQPETYFENERRSEKRILLLNKGFLLNLLK